METNILTSIWEFFINSPFFGITFSIVIYMIGEVLFKATKGFFLFTPLFVATLFGSIILHCMDVSYESYRKGGDILFFFLAPATVAFAIPLYRRVKILKKYLFHIIFSIAVGSVLSVVAVFIVGKLFGLDMALLKSIIPQAATTAIALPIAEQIGGIAPITGYAVIFSTVIVYALGGFFLRICRIKNPIARGIAMGTSGRTLGAAKAAEMGPVEAAMASISVVIVGVIIVFVVPIFLKIAGIAF